MNPSMYLGKEKVAGMAPGGPSGLPGPRPIDAPVKADQTSAGYGDSNAKCAVCRFFDGQDACSKVDGMIDPGGHSRFFEAKNDQGDTDRDQDTGDIA